ncbi:hypothetical protein [Paractinoplanes hotanensis]|uniref:Uncharacterized protein n=1 Tax=Paractinoplanes hotanensis TaxID=2906497 RepID=A0ABT0Y2P4_9ACTN|nr:hypothetical protein [Actinoplanes hotanensis]MCM4080296.1 hypothetical protein [Actinoplanes hotanensis]
MLGFSGQEPAANDPILEPTAQQPTADEPTAGPVGWGDAAIGAGARLVRGAVDAGTAVRVRVDGSAAGLRRWAGELAEQGAAERGRAAETMAEQRSRAAATVSSRRSRMASAVAAAVDTVATSPLVDRVVDAQVSRILRPLVRTVLDDVLTLLEQEAERIQPLVRGQRDSMVDELVGRIRTGAAAGDDAVDRMTSRMRWGRTRPARIGEAPVAPPPVNEPTVAPVPANGEIPSATPGVPSAPPGDRR